MLGVVLTALYLIAKRQIVPRGVDWIDALDLEEDREAYGHGTSAAFV